MKIFDLPCLDQNHSFCEKAKVKQMDNGDTVLQSYNTDVCRVTASGEFVRMWGGWSATTGWHVKSFLVFMCLDGGCKSWWMAQPVEKRPGT